ncbi:MAG TPA: flagellar hook-basal body complex protein FliE [Acidimicrobiales bacterium]|nr:flagellar hook-basal body complex protein FliE [Acidimicrobiales bacterium]
MAILPPIGAVGAAGSAFPTAATARTRPAAEEDPSFGDAVIKALENLNSSQKATDGLAQQAATGDLKAIEDYMVMATETQLMTQLTVAVRNRAVEAFNDIMRMQV